MSKKRTNTSSEKKVFKHNFKGSLSLVIPCYKESKRVNNLLNSLKSFDRLWENPLEIIIVDDGSSDDTVEKIEDLFEGVFNGNTTFELLQLGQNQGKGAALKAGVEKSTGDVVLTIDADMAVDPSELQKWLQMLPGNTFQENEILIGSREHESSKVKGLPIRRIAGLIFNFIIQLFTNLNLTDTQCGFKLYPKDIAKKLFGSLKTKGWAHDIELLNQSKFEGVAIKPMPVKWTHQDDSKISLFSDSIKMLFATIGISLRQNWNWFVAQPIKDLKKGIPTSGEPSWYRLLFIVTTVTLLFAMPYLSFDFGVTGDEHVQKEYGELILKHFETDGTYKNKEGENALNFENLYYYGGLFDYATAWLNEHIGGFDEYDMRHLLNAFVGFLMILFTGLLAREVSDSWRIAFFALLFMALSPRIFGHSMNNPKDIPFAAAYVFTLLHLTRFLKQLPKPGSKTVVMLIIGIAAAINVRVGGILLIAYFGLFTGMSYLIRPALRSTLSNFRQTGKIVIIGLLVVIFSYFGGMLYWPYALEAPFSHPLKALSEMSNFSTSIRMLFEGKHLWSDELPWYYIPKYIAIASPIFILIGLPAFVGFYFYKIKKINPFPLLFIAFTAVFPVAYAVYKESSLYDGMRHFLFIYPVLAVLTAWAWGQLIELPKMRWVMSGVLVILMLLPTYWMVKNHPYQYTYFNELAGGVDSAYAKYETDYWMSSVKNMCEYLIENDERIKNGETVSIHTNCYYPASQYMKRLAPNVNVHYTRYNDRNKTSGDYFMFISRFVNKDLLKNDAWPPAEVIYTEKADNTVLGAISKRPAILPAFEASEAEKTKDFATAELKFLEATQQDPKDEASWLGLANARLNLRKLPEAKIAIDGFLKLSDTHVNGLFALAIYYINIGNNEEAKQALEKITVVNYKYNGSYFYLTSIYAQEQKFDKALAAAEKYDEVGGRAVQIYDIGIQIAQDQGKQAIELYLRSKKAYYAQQGSEALNLLAQSLRVDPAYKLAVNFDRQLKEQIEKQRAKAKDNNNNK
ncbi:MAG: glycosyltransferase involved in cell wall biosynthesis [Saprospiraceae bacterium]|jgi:glycosyltransferase involved in cell wall biosynthesis